jgi:hypothetical protein
MPTKKSFKKLASLNESKSGIGPGITISVIHGTNEDSDNDEHGPDSSFDFGYVLFFFAILCGMLLSFSTTHNGCVSAESSEPRRGHVFTAIFVLVTVLDFLGICCGKKPAVEWRFLTGGWRLWFLYELLGGLPLPRWLIMICTRVFAFSIQTIPLFFSLFEVLEKNFIVDNDYLTRGGGCAVLCFIADSSFIHNPSRTRKL